MKKNNGSWLVIAFWYNWIFYSINLKSKENAYIYALEVVYDQTQINKNR